MKTQIKTHLMDNKDLELEQHTCKFCGKDAHYWTQAEQGYKPKSKCVFHCQNHRTKARQIVNLLLTSF